MEIAGVIDRLKEQDFDIELSKAAIELLVDKGFDQMYGARPLKRTIQRLLEDPLAEDIISGRFKNNHKVKADRKDDIIVFK